MRLPFESSAFFHPESTGLNALRWVLGALVALYHSSLVAEAWEAVNLASSLSPSPKRPELPPHFPCLTFLFPKALIAKPKSSLLD
jgi:hypothetical protein